MESEKISVERELEKYFDSLKRDGRGFKTYEKGYIETLTRHGSRTFVSLYHLHGCTLIVDEGEHFCEIYADSKKTLDECVNKILGERQA